MAKTPRSKQAAAPAKKQIIVHVPVELHAWIAAGAKANFRGIAGQVTAVLEEARRIASLPTADA